jgi:holo-[acyl-carrier protein] synthase
MIFGVGVDIVEVRRIRASLDRFGTRFPGKVLTAFELDEYERSRRKIPFLAKHFAAKEACAKALGTGFKRGVGLRSIEVRSEPSGRPYLVCYGAAKEFMEHHNISITCLSLADESEYAIAQVTLESP